MIEKIPLRVYITITVKNNRPAILLRRMITDEKIIKQIINKGLYNEEIIVVPTFQDKIKSINSLVDKGIIYWDEETKNYEYTF